MNKPLRCLIVLSFVYLLAPACDSPGATADPSAALGSPPPALHTTTLAGESVDLAELAGKVVVVDFWATWCEPCGEELPELATLQQEFGASGLVVIGVSVDDDRAEIDRYLELLPVEIRIIHDHDDSIAEAWDPPAMPTSYVIDRAGKLAHRQLGYRHGDADKLRAAVEAALAQE